ncbi:MAG: hypothetical protein J0L92_34030 [Deltaproteobacteria bacterium]|nr:hypothetical protein [Deltaproteobacteria bacterium]
MSRPDLHDEFVDLLECLRAEGCEFVVVGAHADAAVLEEIKARRATSL